MSLSSKIFIGLGLGVLLGLFFGEHVAFLKIGADIFVLGLQITVLPFVMLSLMTGLGSLDMATARTLALRVGGLLVVLWVVTFAILAVFGISFPRWETAAFFSSSLVAESQSLDLYSLYIPSNPFGSMANNMIPAVVMFSVLVGIALIGVERKKEFLAVLDTFKEVISRMTNAVVRTTPYGVFAIAGHAAGTMSVSELGRLQIFVVGYILVNLVVAFVVLPGLVTALTPLTWRQIIGGTKDALVTAFMTGSLFVVLPMLSERCKEMLREADLGGRNADAMTDVIVPASFNFPNTGKLLLMAFVPFAGWFTNAPIELNEFPAFATSGLVTFFGSTTVAIPFLLDQHQIPADMFQLYMVMTVLTSRFATLVAAICTLVLGIVGTCAITGRLRFNPQRILRWIGISAGATLLAVFLCRLFFESAVGHVYDKDQVIRGMDLQSGTTPAIVLEELPPSDVAAPPDETTLERVKRRGALRVGVLVQNIPYVYYNVNDNLVGFDIEMAHHLADDLGVTLEFVPMQYDRIESALETDRIDLAMSGIVVTTDRAARVPFTRSYLDETIAFLVPDHMRQEFSDPEWLKNQDDLTIGCGDVPYYRRKLERVLPAAKIVTIDTIDTAVAQLSATTVDAVLLTAERASAVSLLHPNLTVAIPGDKHIKMPVAYPVAAGDASMLDFMNTFIELKEKDGTVQKLYDYWILGKDAQPRGRRWSVLHDVLGW